MYLARDDDDHDHDHDNADDDDDEDEDGSCVDARERAWHPRHAKVDYPEGKSPVTSLPTSIII